MPPLASSPFLDPLPTDLTLLISTASASNALGVDSVSSIIERLDRVKSQLSTGAPADQLLLGLSAFVKGSNVKMGAAHKEWAGAVNKLAKGVDKKFGAPPLSLFPPPNRAPPASTSSLPVPASPSPPPLGHFSSPEALTALNETIAHHLSRLGLSSSLSVFLDESSTASPPPDVLQNLALLHSIVAELKTGKCTKALAWIEENKENGADEQEDLEFALRKDEFIRILLDGLDTSGESDPFLPPPAVSTMEGEKGRGYDPSPNSQRALAYGGLHFRRLLTHMRHKTITSLFTAPLYMPLSRLLSSPYAYLFTPYVTCTSPRTKSPHDHEDHPMEVDPSPAESEPLPTTNEATQSLIAQFSLEFLSTVKLARDSPLQVVTDVGGGGAMSRILKVASVMKEKKTEWSAVDELPVEIPLPTRYKYHSIFACPVSKEQSTENNPPMLLPCGHVIARESLMRLARGTASLKCPYCPTVSPVAAAVRVFF